MKKSALFLSLALVWGLGACAPAPPAPIPAAAPAAPPAPAETTGGMGVEPSVCVSFQPGQREWFELEKISGPLGDNAVVSRFVLPAADASRYNTVLEVCPGLWFVLTHTGESRLLDLDEGIWSRGPTLSPSGATRSLSAPGVESGGPTWGFRDSTLAGNQVFISDGVLDTDQRCVRIDVHALSLSDLLSPASEATTEVVYQSTPCVSYQDPYREASPLRTHLGAALVYSPLTDSLFLTIGDFHLAASSLSQAQAIGLANTEKDYALLADPAAAIGAVIEIPLDGGEPQIVAKGLRNSLGITLDGEGSLWISDHGPRGGDELNLFARGANYGWPLTTMGEPYDRSSWPDDPNQLLAPWLDNGQKIIPGTTDPALWWTPAIAPTGVVSLSSSLMALGGLASEAIIVVSRDGDQAREIRRITLGQRVRDLAGDEKGSRLIAITDSATVFVISTAAIAGE